LSQIPHREGTTSAYHKADVSNEDQVRGVVSRAIGEFGRIGILLNNAGLQQDAPFDQMRLEQWNTVIRLDPTGQHRILGRRLDVFVSSYGARLKPENACGMRRMS
jgi:NAD(P)-dependent dehydrogenase (short-subunit alcohol dehydrogenase family)